MAITDTGRLVRGQYLGMRTSIYANVKVNSRVAASGIIQARIGMATPLAANDNVYLLQEQVTGSDWVIIGVLDGTAVMPDRSKLAMYLYGDSYTLNPGLRCTPGQEFFNQAARGLAIGGSITTYGVTSTRIFDVACALVTLLMPAGIAGQAANARWPGVSNRPGLIVLDTEFNDVGHYPDMTLSPVHPAAITTANTQYQDGVTDCYRTALAMMCTDTRVEQTSATFTGTWINTALTTDASGESMAYTTTPGAAVSWSVTPPQSGPMAGKVFFVSWKLTSTGFTMAQLGLQVDGGTTVNKTPTGFEQYKGFGGGEVIALPWVWTVQLPVDGNAHTVTVTHAGSSGQLFYADAIFIPSTTPNPIAVMQSATPPKAETGYFTSGDVGVWQDNFAILDPLIKSVVAEFPTAVWVPSTITLNGLSNIDGIHPNDRGMAQRANDLVAAMHADPLLRSLSLALTPDASYTTL